MGRKKLENIWDLLRLNITNERTHDIILSFKMTRAGFFIWLVTGILVLAFIFYSAVAFTPLRRTIPGYPDARSRQQAIYNAIKVDSLESMMTRWELYSNNLRMVLTGEEVISEDSLLRSNGIQYLEEKSREFAHKDSLLRNIVANEERFAISDNREKVLPTEGKQFFTPVKGVISKHFDALSNPGVNINTPNGSMVMAVLDGTVIHTSWSDFTGYVMMVQHKGNLVSVYENLQQLLKHSGEVVSAGSVIALTGSDNASSEEYLHFELWDDGKAVDPTKYIIF